MFNPTHRRLAPPAPPGTFTALVTRPGQLPKEIPNAKVWNGVVVRLIKIPKSKKARTDYWQAESDDEVVEKWPYYAYVPAPLFIYHKFRSEQERETVMALDAKCNVPKYDWSPIFDNYRHTFAVMGDNGEGCRVEEKQAAEQRMLNENRNLTLIEGFRGVKMVEKVPTHVWFKIAAYGRYYSRTEIADWYEDIDEFDKVDTAGDEAGYSFGAGIIPILIDAGYALTYQNEPITDESDIGRIDGLVRQRKIEAEQRRLARSAQRQALRQHFSSLVKWEVMLRADTPRVVAMPDRWLSPTLGWTGRGLAGVGFWGRLDEKYVYMTDQNGADGDAWARDNSTEGIIYRAPLTDDLRALIESIKQFDNQS